MQLCDAKGSRYSKWVSVMMMAGLLLSACNGGELKQEGGEAGQSTPSAKVDEVKTVRVVLPVDSEEEKFFREQNELFMKKNPKIKVNFIANPTDSQQYGNAIQLMFASNESPDIFRISGSYPTKMTVSYAKGWLKPLTPFVSPELKGMMPSNFFSPNSGLYVGKDLYGTPLMDVQFNGFRPFYYNMELLKKYGYDAPPATWSELKKMATDITRKGEGKVFGFGAVGQEVINPILSLSDYAANSYADAHVTEGSFIYDLKTGKQAANNPTISAAIKLIKELNDTKVMATGWESWNVQMSIQQFAAGKVAMIIGNAFWPVEFYKVNPDLKLGITAPPLPDSGRGGYRYIYNATEPYFGISSKSNVANEAFKLLEFYATPEFQEAFYVVTGRPTYLWEKYSKQSIKPYTLDIMTQAKKSLRVAPYPGFLHDDGEELLSNIQSKTPKPNLRELFMLDITGGKNYEELAADYDRKMEKIIDDELAAMKKKGSSVTRDIFMAPKNWNPNEDYKN
jgi:multiple sugar transport system substrate-binding protein